MHLVFVKILLYLFYKVKEKFLETTDKNRIRTKPKKQKQQQQKKGQSQQEVKLTEASRSVIFSKKHVSRKYCVCLKLFSNFEVQLLLNFFPKGSAYFKNKITLFLL